MTDSYEVVFDSIRTWMLIVIIGASLGNLLVLLFGLYTIFSQIIFQGIGILVLWMIMSRDPERYQFSEVSNEHNFKQKFLWGLNYWLIYIGVFYLIGQFMAFIVSLFEDVTISSYINLVSGWQQFIFLFIALVVIAPVFEELIFRKYLIHRFINQGYSHYAALFFSTIIFALVHMFADIRLGTFGFALQHFVILLGGGLLFGIIYLHTKNIVFPILVHMVSNLYGILPLLVSELFPSTSRDKILYYADPSQLSPDILFNIQVFIISQYIFVGFSLLAVIFFIFQTYQNYEKWETQIWGFVQNIFKFLPRTSSFLLLLFAFIGFFVIPYCFLLISRQITDPDLAFLSTLVVPSGYVVSFLFAVFGKYFLTSS